jgi:D-sedoheptulose 7-phosphate isomerase
MASITAIGNDYGYGKTFERQVEAFAQKGDVVVGISTSGNSANVIDALKKANDMGCITIGLSGETGGKLKDVAKYTIKVNAQKAGLIQDGHRVVIHLICGIIEDML